MSEFKAGEIIRIGEASLYPGVTASVHQILTVQRLSVENGEQGGAMVELVIDRPAPIGFQVQVAPYDKINIVGWAVLGANCSLIAKFGDDLTAEITPEISRPDVLLSFLERGLWVGLKPTGFSFDWPEGCYFVELVIVEEGTPKRRIGLEFSYGELVTTFSNQP